MELCNKLKLQRKKRVMSKRGEQRVLLSLHGGAHTLIHGMLRDILLISLTPFVVFVLYSFISSVFYQPKKRYGHSAVLLNRDIYVWGGRQDGLPKVHNSDLKLRMTSVIEVFRGRVGR